MITHLDMYLFTRLDAINDGLKLIMGITVLSAVVSGLLGHIEFDDDQRSKIFKWARKSIYIFLVALFMCVVIPNQKSAAAIYLVPKMVANEDMQEIPGNAAKAMNELLKEWIQELKPNETNTN